MSLFVRLTLALTFLIVVAITLVFVLKALAIAAVLAALVIGGAYVVRLVRGRRTGVLARRGPLTRRL